MKTVLCFGEALIDFLNTSTQTDEELQLNNYRQYPGGAPANVAVAVAKLGGKALFAGQVGNDVFGDFLESALQSYNVDTRFLYKHPVAKTALAFVTLDEKGDRSFSFYRDNSADVIFDKQQVSHQWFSSNSIFHFCSNTLTQNNIACCTDFAVTQALKYNSIISFDVNLRHNLWPKNRVCIDVVNNFIPSAHVLKFSAEEFGYLSEGNTEKYIEFCFTGICQLLLITNGEHEITYYTKIGVNTAHPPEVVAVDTTAAGDGFMGGMLFSIAQYNDLSDLVDHSEALKKAIKFSALCGAIAVTRPGAYPALPTLDEVNR